jgi:thioredoxin 1
MVEHLDSENFNSTITNSNIAIVDFWADWCMPCKQLSNILEEFEIKLGAESKLFKVNVDKNPALVGQYGIESIPTIIIFKNGSPISSIIGLQSKNEIEKAIFSAIS